MIGDRKINQFGSSESGLPPGISFIQGVFWFLVSSGFLIILVKALGYENAKKIPWVEILLSTIVNLAVLLGLYKKKSWVVPLALINASWTFISQFLQLLGGTDVINARILTQKFTHLVFGIFCIYQIFLFTKRETKAYFRWKGQTIM